MPGYAWEPPLQVDICELTQSDWESPITMHRYGPNGWGPNLWGIIRALRLRSATDLITYWQPGYCTAGFMAAGYGFVRVVGDFGALNG
jgi:hypothetical protein